AAPGLEGDPDMDDRNAVEGVRRLTGRHHDAIRVAEIQSRRGGEFVDLPVENRAQRLLEAALTGQPIRPVTDDDARRMETVDAFADLPLEDAWQELVRQ